MPDIIAGAGIYGLLLWCGVICLWWMSTSYMLESSDFLSWTCRSREQWIYGLSQGHLQQRVEDYLQSLNRYSAQRVLLLLSDPVEFLALYVACLVSQTPVFLGNPTWKSQELDQARAIANPDLIYSDSGIERFQLPQSPTDESGWIMIPTGGTSGQIKFAIHTLESLSAAVGGMQSFFWGNHNRPIHSYCMLPLYHVSGLMQFMRSLLSGGKFVNVPYRRLLQDPTTVWEIIPNADFFLSLVPTQLSRLLSQDSPELIQWLSQFHCILLGGAPSPISLLEQARHYQLPLAPTYGMTETGAQVMTLKPEQFLAGQQVPSEILPHVTLRLCSQADYRLQASGQMEWSGPSICYGYYPNFEASQCFLTDDVAFYTASGHLQIKGRASRKIISGGENIYPEEIESVLLTMQEIEDVCVFGVPDADWGECVVAAYTTSEDDLPIPLIAERLRAILAAYKCPKVWWRSPIPFRNSQGKVNVTQLKAQYSTSFCNTPSLNPELDD